MKTNKTRESMVPLTTKKQRAEYNGVNTSNWGAFSPKRLETLEAILNQVNPVINPDACCERDKRRYENHLYTQQLIRRYVGGRDHDTASPLRCVRDAANTRQSQLSSALDERDYQLINAFVGKNHSVRISVYSNTLGKCINFELDSDVESPR